MDRNDIEELINQLEEPIDWTHFVNDDHAMDYQEFHMRSASALRHLLQAMRWRPIEDARKDGTPYLIYNSERCSCCPPDAHGQMVGRWFKVGWMVGRNQKGVNVFAKHQPTHFMPLPNPPSTDEERASATPSEQQSEGEA